MGKLFFTTPAKPFMGKMGMCHSWFMGNFLFPYSWLRHSYGKIPSLILSRTGLAHCQLGLFPYFLPKTHSWYYPIIRDFSLFIRQKSLIVMVLWAHFSQKAAFIFTAKYFMNFPQILKRFHRVFFFDFQSVLFMSYLVCIFLHLHFIFVEFWLNNMDKLQETTSRTNS